jgi:hypothetical protein
MVGDQAAASPWDGVPAWLVLRDHVGVDGPCVVEVSAIEVISPVKRHDPSVVSGAAGEWITWPEAAAIVGCPVPTIEHYAREGQIIKRPRRGARPGGVRSPLPGKRPGKPHARNVSGPGPGSASASPGHRPWGQRFRPVW